MGKIRKNIPSDTRSSCLHSTIGFVFLIGGVVVLFWNEGKAVETTRSLNTALEGIRSLPSINIIHPENDGALVYICGPIHVEEPLTEPEYGISVPAVILKRRVQMYQWIEVLESPSNGEEESFFPDGQYSYYTEWRDKLVDSSKFHFRMGHLNPKSFPITSGVYVSETVRIGSFLLTEEIKRKFTDFTLITSDERPERRDIKMHAGLYYHTLDVWNPEVGDTRVQFSYAGNSGDVVSIIAQQMNDKLGGKGLLLLEPGRVPAEQMITNQHNKNVWIIRLYRTLGWLCIYISTTFFKQMLNMIEVRHGCIFEFFVMGGKLSPNFSLSTGLALCVVSSIWFCYKPLLGIGMAIMTVLPFIINTYFKDRKCTNRQYHQL